MDQENLSSFDEFEVKPFSRRTLLPVWMKAGCWFFMFMGGLSLLSFIEGIFGSSAGIEFYGLNDDSTFSIKGMILTTVLLFKAFTAYSLWFEKNYAITLGKIDAVAGIIFCIVMMVLSPSMNNNIFSFRIEILFIIPYYMRLSKIEYAWYNKQYD